MPKVSQAIDGLRRENRFFHLFTAAELEVLQPLFHLTRNHSGETLIEEGDPTGGPFAIVLSGALEIKKQTDFGSQVVLAKVTRGALLGHSSVFLRNRPSPITAVARENTEILYLPPEQLAALLESHPAIGVKILQEVIRVQDIRLQELVERFAGTL